ncbi:MAG: phosphatidylglycerophosphatase A [Proteobacteria bacterium]|nr:phosphatidylglycerophosphatase A [Pseudomonadota bacterium]
MYKKIINFLATGAHIGDLPKMPGTFGTLWGIPVVFILSCYPPYIYVAATIVFFIAASFISGEAERNYNQSDPGRIIIDEVVGITIAFFLIPFTLVNVIIVFLLFRFFDILKPFPIKQLDKRVKGGFGIVLDDAVAGIFANIVMHLIGFIR